MINNIPEFADISEPRFEFRSFGQNFDRVHFRMARLSSPIPEKFWERFSEEIYIISQKNDNSNIKIRDLKLDIKTLVRTVEGLEQWNPVFKAAFPLTAEMLKDVVFSNFLAKNLKPDKALYQPDDFLNLIKLNPDLQAVRVRKQRFGYLVNNTICEYGIVLFNGARVVTVSSESAKIKDIQQTLKDLELENVENINYIQAIKRVTGMIAKPLANED